MSFSDSLFQSAYIVFDSTLGAEFKTQIVQVNSGSENRNSVWEFPLVKGDWGGRRLPESELTEIINWFYAMGGMAGGFRLNDAADHTVPLANGTLNALPTVPATNLSVGSAYQISSVGTSNFTGAGAPSNTLGTTFTATGPTTGTGTCVPIGGQLLSSGVGNGGPSYQLVKNYPVGGANGQRLITKIVTDYPANKLVRGNTYQITYVGSSNFIAAGASSNTVGTVFKANSQTTGTGTCCTDIYYRNGALLVKGSAAGNISENDNTGIVTFVPDASAAASAITAGATTDVTLASNPYSLAIGQYLYLNGFTDPHGVINGQSALIANIVGLVFTLTLDTRDLGSPTPTPPTLGSGYGYAYPQPTDGLNFQGEFDIPVRFDTDQLKYSLIGMDIQAQGVRDTKYFNLDNLPIVEIRDVI